MKRFALAGLLALALGSQADAQIVRRYAQPAYYPSNRVVGGYYTPSYYASNYYAPSYYAPSYYAPSYYEPSYYEPSYYMSTPGTVVAAGYYSTPSAWNSGGYYSPSYASGYSYSSGYNYSSPRYGVLGGRRAWR